MKKICILLVLITMSLSVVGCAVKGQAVTLECVSDTLDAPLQQQYFLCAEIPKEMLLETISNDRSSKVYVHEDGDYEMLMDVFTAASLDDALLSLTGYNFAELAPISMDSYPLDEYRYAWTTAGENGELACCGTLFFDGTHYYSLTIRCPAQLEKKYHDTFSHILTTVGLQGNEGF